MVSAAVMIQFISYKTCIYQVEIIIALILDNLTVNILNQADQKIWQQSLNVILW